MPEGVVCDVSDVLGLICLWNAEGQSGNAGATPMLEVGRDMFTDCMWQTPKGHCLNDVVWNAVTVGRGPSLPPQPKAGAQCLAWEIHPSFHTDSPTDFPASAPCSPNPVATSGPWRCPWDNQPTGAWPTQAWI